MIETLSIRNFALFEDSEVDFHEGMNALLGASGAGKSMIIDAISLLKGERSEFDKVRVGEKKAVLEGVFRLSEERFAKWKEDYPDLIEENPLIVSRTLDINNKSVARINGQMVPMSLIRTLMNEEIDIHSQNQNYALLDEKNHLSLLEQFAVNEEAKKVYESEYLCYLEKKKAYEDVCKLKKDDDQIEAMKEELDAIELLALEEGEYQKLLSEQKKIDQLENYLSKYQHVLDLFEQDQGILSQIYEAKKEIESLRDEELDAWISSMEEHDYALRDLKSEIEDRFERLQNGEYSPEYVENRLQAIKKVLRKYHYDEEEMRQVQEEYRHDLLILSDQEVAIEKALKEKDDQYQKLLKAGKQYSHARKEIAKKLEEEVQKQFADLLLKDAKFQISFTTKNPTSDGMDSVRFLLSANVGTPLLPLRQVASGGESSRIMLALKAVFSASKSHGTLVYDEVDVGVSGAISFAIGKKIQEISNKRQVLVISHSPQVLCFSRYAYEVKKEVVDETTRSEIKELNEKEFLEGLASLLSTSEVVSSNTLRLAKELREKAKNC